MDIEVRNERGVSLRTSGGTHQVQAAALHILSRVIMGVKLDGGINLWRNYVQLPILAQFKLSAHTGLAALPQAVKNSDSRSTDLVFSTLCPLAQETGDAEIAIRAKEILEKVYP